ncbi:uncharacterized protein MONOS_7064 [Monocercomonoides exilis]|uniref:uncharacterized protein n=1 Tax=Monocercomonoides exilis TaxID=2049356 RepID=UPI003559E53F|nr:hypothetical protein MONOS_7064 [Monocercomonoides exilis]|eukprot:MONOS_7064.1-p1 / transcript=MONOS_7064.1 / gene=MONOS_7064 / organism=Monocercomonoides_exilis_PA203 / gene_product=unspecified product / transcript_product=unspecified product / location=Mono_scaffold00234:10278-11389(+) / protein_length=328 / sequence_SO=supercontig / SO=protein_coding / is_pseudo=false
MFKNELKENTLPSSFMISSQSKQDFFTESIKTLLKMINSTNGRNKELEKQSIFERISNEHHPESFEHPTSPNEKTLLLLLEKTTDALMREKQKNLQLRIKIAELQRENSLLKQLKESQKYGDASSEACMDVHFHETTNQQLNNVSSQRFQFKSSSSTEQCDQTKMAISSQPYVHSPHLPQKASSKFEFHTNPDPLHTPPLPISSLKNELKQKTFSHIKASNPLSSPMSPDIRKYESSFLRSPKTSTFHSPLRSSTSEISSTSIQSRHIHPSVDSPSSILSSSRKSSIEESPFATKISQNERRKALKNESERLSEYFEELKAHFLDET